MKKSAWVDACKAACLERFAGEHLLARVWCIGGRLRLVPFRGREALFAREAMVMDVMISQARRYVCGVT